MNKKKILFHINSLGKGGAERVVSVLARYFAKDGYEIVIVTLWRAGEEYALPREVKRIDLGELAEGRKGGRRLLALRRFTDLRAVIRKERPSVVISFCVKANFRSAFAMLGMKTPLLVSVRNDPKIDYAPHKWATKWMEHKAKGCVFQTEEAMKFFSQAFQKKSCVIWNPVDEKYLSAREPGAQADKHKRARRDVVVTVGRISRQKNQMLLLQAFDVIKDKFPDIKLQIYGEKGDSGVKEELESYIAENKLEERILFMGQCSTLEKEIKDAALFVLPSDYEGMPNALIEAMVLGLPVVATDCPCGGAAMLVKEGVSGFLVPVGDRRKMAEAMERILSDREMAESMAENAGKVADKVSPMKIYGEWKEVVEAL